MENKIAYCGLDCEKCDAYIATKNNDQELREKTAKLWSELNGIEILPEHINCDGCKADGRKTIFCERLCSIRPCAMENCYENCGQCSEMETCEKLAMITSDNEEARNNLSNG